MILSALLMMQAAEPANAIEAERAFARDAQDIGQWTAFEKWADESGVLVGSVVLNAREFAASQENPAEALKWWPTRSLQSCDETVAFNYGGWVGPEEDSGQFHTIWQRKEDGWRYLADIGSRGSMPLPDTGSVEIVRPDCGTPVSILVREPPIPEGWQGQFGLSADATLRWRWMLDPKGTKHIIVTLWQGDEYEEALRLVIPKQ